MNIDVFRSLRHILQLYDCFSIISKLMPLVLFPAENIMLLRYIVYIIIACINNDDNDEDDYDYSDCEHKS